ncbi:MAG: hypothetical protein EBY80_13210, partial [Actinobacteria bacterium]|nr:hypothetical protein [Actinomycetota bacterium]
EVAGTFSNSKVTAWQALPSTVRSGLKPGIKMWFGGMKPMEFSTEAEATKEITSKVLDHIHQYKDDFAEFIKGWEK